MVILLIVRDISMHRLVDFLRGLFVRVVITTKGLVHMASNFFFMGSQFAMVLSLSVFSMLILGVYDLF